MDDKLKCDWCGAKMKKLAKVKGWSFVWIVKCTKCHHEAERVLK